MNAQSQWRDRRREEVQQEEIRESITSRAPNQRVKRRNGDLRNQHAILNQT